MLLFQTAVSDWKIIFLSPSSALAEFGSRFQKWSKMAQNGQKWPKNAVSRPEKPFLGTFEPIIWKNFQFFRCENLKIYPYLRISNFALKSVLLIFLLYKPTQRCKIKFSRVVFGRFEKSQIEPLWAAQTFENGWFFMKIPKITQKSKKIFFKF